jgi:hypothetical protein
MPITENILDHEVLGREFKKGRAEGLLEGRREGLLEARREGEIRVLRRQITKLFAVWLEEQLARCSSSDLEDVCDRLFDAHSPEDLFRKT